MQQVVNLQYRFVAPNPSSAELSELKLSQFIDGGKAAVVVIVQPDNGNVSIGLDYVTQGFYRYSQFNAWNSYSNKNDPDKMADDQFQKMRQRCISPDHRLFLLSWTLTQPEDFSAVFRPSHCGPERYGKLLQRGTISRFHYPCT
jgi:hypothetical protein